MDLKSSHFKFTALLKNEQNIQFEALELFPGLNEISFQSRPFSTYAECVKSCKGIIEDITRDVNSKSKEPRFKIAAEVNPAVSGTASISRDWGESEVARFWVYDKSFENTGNIAAVCKSSIFAIPREGSVLLN